MNRKFWENLVSLYGVHILNYIVPLVTLPFLAHRLGPVHWGELAFAEAYASYISLFIEYGFGLSATRDLAQVRDDEAARSRLLAGVIGAQAFLTFCALALTLLLGYGLQVFAAYRPLLPFAFGLATLRAMSPVWYFQGIERMQSVAVITIISNVAAMAAMLVLVQSAADAWIPLALRAGAAFISAAIAYLIAYQDTRFRVPSVSYVWSALRTGWSLFLFKSAVSLYTTANVLLLGILARPSEVAWFAGAEKIAKAAAGGVTPITQAFYPRINYLLAKDRPHAKRAAQMSVLVTIGSGLALGIPAWVAAPWLVRLLLGSGFDKAVPVLRLL
jgi:polysaccharide transporter, PST family